MAVNIVLALMGPEGSFQSPGRQTRYDKNCLTKMMSDAIGFDLYPISGHQLLFSFSLLAISLMRAIVRRLSCSV